MLTSFAVSHFVNINATTVNAARTIAPSLRFKESQHE
jgi:hypothetical protein